MTPADLRATATDAIALTKAIEPRLKGHPAAVHGAALAQLLAIFLAGHPQSARDRLLDMHIASVRRLVPVIIKERGLDDP